ncbi:MAG: hypothetical protein GW875_15305, partial [Deltaproteobacteria bacterium]|nr:hypothetical protein [Deltaproteobacteria bacterium]
MPDLVRGNGEAHDHLVLEQSAGEVQGKEHCDGGEQRELVDVQTDGSEDGRVFGCGLGGVGLSE